jgi:hypothetical protein
MKKIAILQLNINLDYQLREAVERVHELYR